MSNHLPVAATWVHTSSAVRHVIDVATDTTLTLRTGTAGLCTAVHAYMLSADAIGTYTWLSDDTTLAGPMGLGARRMHADRDTGSFSTKNEVPVFMLPDGEDLKISAANCRITGYCITYQLDTTV